MVEKNTFSVALFVKKGKLRKNGEAPVYLRITVRGIRKEISAKMNIRPEHWDSARTKVKVGVKDATDKNNYLAIQVSKIHELKRHLADKDIDITADNIVDAYLGRTDENKGVMQLFLEHNTKCEELRDRDYSSATIQKYTSCRKILGEYISRDYNRKDISIKSIDPKFIKGFEHYIKTVRNCSHNTTLKYLANFKKIIIMAMNNGLINLDPFRNFKFKKERKYPVYLDELELEQIRMKEIKINRLERVRDIFIFCCFTGLAYIDVKNLAEDDISTNADKSKCIKKPRQKSGTLSYIPLLNVPLQILEKYNTDPICQKSNKLLPVLTNQKMNAYLKELADLCNIKKDISMHTARHTFATTVTLSNNISIEVVSEMLGHSSIQMTKHYAKVVNNKISTEMKKVEQKYKITNDASKELLSNIFSN